MMSIQQFQLIIANALFQGDTMLQGLTMFIILMGFIFAIARDNFQLGLMITLPQAIFCSIVGILTGEIAILVVIISVLSIAVSLKTGIGTST